MKSYVAMIFIGITALIFSIAGIILLDSKWSQDSVIMSIIANAFWFIAFIIANSLYHRLNMQTDSTDKDIKP